MPPQKGPLGQLPWDFPGLLTHGKDHVICSAQLLLHVIHSREDLGPMALIVEIFRPRKLQKKGIKSSSL